MFWQPEYANTWLIACECSGRIRDAMLARGIPAISCDLKPTRSPGPHLQCDVREILHWPWPGMIAHPVCRYLTQAGVRWLYIDGQKANGLDFQRWADMRDGAEFYGLFCDATHIPLRAVENPIMHPYAVELIGHKADQFVQPHWFGSPKTKATGFKLYGLPKLPREWPYAWYAEAGIKIEAECHEMPPGPDREELRSNTDPAVARAIAQYWGHLILRKAA